MLLHLAMEWEGLVVKDSSVLETLGECLNGMAECGEGKERSKVLCKVKTKIRVSNLHELYLYLD